MLHNRFSAGVLLLCCLWLMVSVQAQTAPQALPAAHTPAGPGPTLPRGAMTVNGTLTVTYGDPLPNSGDETQIRVELHTDSGDVLLLDTPVGPAQTFHMRRVQVQASPSADAPAHSGQARWQVQTLTVLDDPNDLDAASAFDGEQRWASLLCRFSDTTGMQSLPQSHFRTLMGDTLPGMHHYWDVTSYGNNDTQGQDVFGWYDLAAPSSAYVDLQGEPLLGKIFEDCAAAADADVDFTQYVGIALNYNIALGCCAWGGGDYATLDGESRVWRVIWMPPWAYTSTGILAHEMGHAYGWPHSTMKNAPDETNAYDNGWDVMSQVGVCAQNVVAPGFGCLHMGSNAYHLDHNDWLAPDETITVPLKTAQTITLASLTTTTPQGRPRRISVPIFGSPTLEYSIEAQTWDGYSANNYAEGVILYHVNPGRLEWAHLVDATANYNTLDEGAVWRVGETYTSPDTGISIEVLSRSGDAFTVRVSNAADVVVPNLRYEDSDLGTMRYTGNWQVENTADGTQRRTSDPNASVSFDVVGSSNMRLYTNGNYDLTLDSQSYASAVTGALAAPQTEASAPIALNTALRWTVTLRPQAGQTLTFDGVLTDNLTTLTANNATSLFDAVQSANSDGLPNLIQLEPGTYTLTDNRLQDLLLPFVADEGFAQDLIIDGGNAAIIQASAGTSAVFLAIDDNADVTLRNLTIRNLTSAYSGTGVTNSGTLTVENVTFENLQSPGWGAAIYGLGPVTVRNSTFRDNVADLGGALAMYEAPLLIEDSVFSGNRAVDGGAVSTNDLLEIQRSSFAGNSATNYGGAVYTWAGETTVANSSFINNSVPVWGGAVFMQAPFSLRFSSFSGNTASNAAGFYSNDPVSVFASLFEGSNPCWGDYTSLGYNIASSGCNSLNATGDLRNTAPGFDIVENGVLTLASDSPALERVTSGCDLAVDQRGTTRPQGAACDSGAYEAPVVTMPLDADGNNAYTATDAIYIINRFGTSDAMADRDGSGYVDENDLLPTMNELGNGPAQ